MMNETLDYFTKAIGHNAAADPVALFRIMFEGAGNLHETAARRRPSPNGSVLRIISGVAAFCVERNPAKFLIRQLGAALPGASCEMRERLEPDHALRSRIEFTVSILPDFRFAIFRRGR